METDEQLRLLRRFEPVIRYTAGELFLPMAVEDYVAGCALVAGTGQRRVVLAERGTLSLDLLSQRGREVAGHSLSLEGVANALDRREYRTWRSRPDRVRFVPSSRFAAVGLLSRLVDAFLRVTLLLRGRVPGGFAAAAQSAYAITPSYRRPVYYGRVVADAGYVALQYWYFYAMNDWRSTFGGINDHEADWEQVTVFVVPEEDGEYRPAWVAFSSHDEVGDDLRRRWDDPDLTTVGEHPVVFAGAGSHSGAYLAGEYVVTTPVPLPEWMRGFRAFWNAIRPWAHSNEASVLSVPYIDYRRGDGERIGPEGTLEWTPVLIDDRTPWVRDFRGLWGLDTSDPLGGERAPAGPRYERSGVVRQAWGQPVAWAGLDKESPSRAEAVGRLAASRTRLELELGDIEQELALRRERLRGGRAAEQANGTTSRQSGRRVAELQAEVANLRARQAELHGVLDGLDRALAAPPMAEPVHAHLSHRALPMTGRRSGRVVRIWAAASAALLLAAVGALLLADGTSTFSLAEVLGGMLVAEALLRRRLVALLVGLGVIGIAVIGLQDAWDFVWRHLPDLLGVVLVAGAALLAWNVAREAWQSR